MRIMAHKKSCFTTMLRHMFCSGLIVMFELVALTSLASPAISGVAARQRYPWNGLVDVIVTIQGTEDDADAAQFSFVATNGTTLAAIPVAHISCNGTAVGSGDVWTRKFIWDAKADVGAVKIDDVILSVDASFGVQLWENGPYWAECNIGATKPEECGYYFWWGDTIGYKRNANNSGWISVNNSAEFSFSSENCPTYNKSISELKSAGYIDSTGNFTAAHDAVTAYLGASWRMPTYSQLSALRTNCTTTWTNRNGMCGRLIRGKGAYSSHSIFLPAAGYGCNTGIYELGATGYFWSVSQHFTDPYSHVYYKDHANTLYWDSGYFSIGNSGSPRYWGVPIRPLREFVQ